MVQASEVVNEQEIRPVLRGANLSFKGITATDGKRLIHIPFELENLPYDFTIPVPHWIENLTEHEFVLSVWKGSSGDVYFSLTAGRWSWSAHALSGTFPDWHAVVPKPETLTAQIIFTAPEAAIALLRTLPETENSAVTLSAGEGGIRLKYSSHTVMLPGTVENLSPGKGIALMRHDVIQLLSNGFTTLKLNGKGHAPVLSEGGNGFMVVMPVYTQNSQTETPKKEAAMTEPEIAQNETQPLEELLDTLEAWKTRFRILGDELSSVIRKVKEASVQQKQQLREELKARRAIERIRLATAC